MGMGRQSLRSQRPTSPEVVQTFLRATSGTPGLKFAWLHVTCSGRISHPGCLYKNQTSHDTGLDSTPPQPALMKKEQYIFLKKNTLSLHIKLPPKTTRVYLCICMCVDNVYTHKTRKVSCADRTSALTDPHTKSSILIWDLEMDRMARGFN